MFLFSPDLDRTIAALTLATTAASMGRPSTVMFAFWGPVILRRPRRRSRPRLVERLLGWMLPRGADDLAPSRLHIAGVGRAMLRRRMRQLNAPDVRELIDMCATLGVEFQVCETSLELLGLRSLDLVDYPHLSMCGAASFLDGCTGNATFFV